MDPYQVCGTQGVWDGSLNGGFQVPGALSGWSNCAGRDDTCRTRLHRSNQLTYPAHNTCLTLSPAVWYSLVVSDATGAWRRCLHVAHYRSCGNMAGAGDAVSREEAGVMVQYPQHQPPKMQLYPCCLQHLWLHQQDSTWSRSHCQEYPCQNTLKLWQIQCTCKAVLGSHVVRCLAVFMLLAGLVAAPARQHMGSVATVRRAPAPVAPGV